MKRKTTYAKSLLLVGIIALAIFFSCKKEDDQILTPDPNVNDTLVIDTIAPTASLAGPNPYYITLNDRYIEYGFGNVSDNYCDSVDLIFIIQNDIDTLEGEYLNVDGKNIKLGFGATIQTGEYDVTYTVIDTAGNKTVLTRIVIIKNSLDMFSRQYNVQKENLTDPNDIYPDYDTELEAYENLNNRILFPNFSNFSGVSLSVYADVRGDSIFIPLQTFSPTSFSYLVEGIESGNAGFAGFVNRSNYGIDITFVAANNVTASQEFHQKYTKF